MVMLFVALVYTYVWSVVVKLVFIFLWYFFAWDIDTRPPNERTYSLACGMLSGTVFEVSRAYIYFWPEYEGKSSWEKGFENNKKGCGAHFTTLSLEVIWPSMTPAYTLEFGEKRTPGYLNILIDPVEISGAGSSTLIDTSLDYFNVRSDQRGQFNESLGLFYSLHGQNIIRDKRLAVYWEKNGLSTDVVIHCSFIRMEELYTCTQIWLKIDIKSYIRVDYAPTMLSNWKSIKNDVEHFIDAHKK